MRISIWPLPLTTKVEVIRVAANDNWLRIRIDNQVGFISRDRVDQVTMFEESRVVFTNVEADFRYGPGSIHALSRDLTPGTEVEVIGIAQNGNWYYVRIDDQLGFVSRIRTIEIDPTTEFEKSRLGVIGVTTADFRQRPGSIHPLIEVLSIGTEIEMIGLAANGNWFYVRVGDQEGYVSRDRVDEITQFEAVRTGVVNTATADLRIGSGSVHPLISVLTVGTEVEIIGVAANGNWLYVRVENQLGFVSRVRIT